MAIVGILFTGLSIVYIGKNKQIDSNAKSISIIALGILGACSIFL